MARERRGSLGSSPDAAGRPDRKTGQLCREVLRSLTETLGACADPVLCELTVLAVEPAPDASRVLALIGLPARRPGDPAPDALAITRLLNERRGMFRADIAAALQRKRTPDLLFLVSD